MNVHLVKKQRFTKHLSLENTVDVWGWKQGNGSDGEKQAYEDIKSFKLD